MRSKLLLLLIFSTISSALLSQEYFFRHYSVVDGMPQSSAYCLLQDERGFIWIGTPGAGVSVFDGKNFRVYNKSDGLSGNIVRSLFEDSDGKIWIGTDNGITIYDGYSLKSVGSEEGLSCSYALRFAETSNGLIWVATNDAGLYAISAKDSIEIRNFCQSDGLVSDFIYDIHVDAENKLWLAMIGGLNILEFDAEKHYMLKEIYVPFIQSDFLTTLEPDGEGAIIAGTYGNGLLRIREDEGSRKYIIDNPYEDSHLKNMIIWDLLLKSNGELTVATDKNGVLFIEGYKTVKSFDTENGLLSNQVLDIIEDNEGNIWFASMGQGIAMFDDSRFIKYREGNDISGTVINSIEIDNNQLIITTNDGVMLYGIEGMELNQNEFYGDDSPLSGLSPNCITKKGSEIWIGTNSGIWIIERGNIRECLFNDDLNSGKVNSLITDSSDNIWIGTDNGYNKIVGGEVFSLNEDQGFINNEVQSIIEDSQGRIWMGTLGGLVQLEGEVYRDYNEEDGLTELRIHSLAEDYRGNIWIGTFGGGIFSLDTGKDSVPIKLAAERNIISSNNIYSLLFVDQATLVAGTDKGFDVLDIDKKGKVLSSVHYNMYDGFSSGEVSLNSIAKDPGGNVWFGTSDGLVRFNPTRDDDYEKPPQTVITGLRLFFNEVDWDAEGFNKGQWFNLPENLVLEHKDNHLTFDFTGFCYHDPDDLEFSYFLEGQSKTWSPYQEKNEVVFSGLAPGEYEFMVRSRNKYGVEGPVAGLAFVIKPPFWRTAWFIITVSFLVFILLIIYIKLRERALINEKIKLEKIVDDRTKEVVEQRNEIAKQRDIVLNQKQEITSSIEYAETIQVAVLPDEKILENSFSDYFIFFRPKDIVSGDFYWMSKKNDSIVFTAGDCTGHGVPGAFMSLLAVSFLNKIVNEGGEIVPVNILECLRDNVIDSLKQKELSESSKDGLDIALCSVNLSKMKLQFAGANNPLYIIREVDGEYDLIEIKADRMPVGFHPQMSKYTCHEFDLKKGDNLYMFSDGYIDQFGGEHGRKFMKKRFKQLLIENQNKSMDEQRELLVKTLDQWIQKGKEKEKELIQVDDIIVMGVKI